MGEEQKSGKLYLKEHSMLRDELRDLKNCQISFLTFSVTATALIFGFIVKLSPIDSQGIFYLSPLIILLPAWCIFFDKATTITRVVGYYRILEDLILEKCSTNDFMGWENALSGLRKIEKTYLFSWNDIPGNDNKRLIGFLKKRFDIELADDAHIEKIENVVKIIYFKENSLTLELNDDKTKAILRIGNVRTDEFIAKKEKDKLNIYEKTEYEIKEAEIVKLNNKQKLSFIFRIFFFQKQPHRYWAMIYSIYFWLSWLCLILYINFNPNIGELIQLSTFIIALILLYFSIINLLVVYQLIYGSYSYNANEHFWKYHLKVESSVPSRLNYLMK